MKKEDVFAKLKYKLGVAYPQYEYVIRDNSLVMHNKSPNTFIEALSVPILRYDENCDKMVLKFPQIIYEHEKQSSNVKEYVAPTIDTYSIDYYNLCDEHIDFIVEHLFTGIIQKQFEKYEKMKKDFE